MSLSELTEYRARGINDLRNKTSWRDPSYGNHPWSGFQCTDPHRHDRSNFAYFVHAIRPIDYSDPMEPIEHFLGKPAASISFIFNGHTATLYGIGLILDVPCENIVSARPGDIGSRILDGTATETEFLAAIKSSNDMYGVWPPEDLKRYAPVEREKNELYAITGFKYSDRRRMTIIGVFSDDTVSSFFSNFAYAWSIQLHVPIVHLDKTW